MNFTEFNTVEQMILEAATSLGSGAGSSVPREDPPAGWSGSLDGIWGWLDLLNPGEP